MKREERLNKSFYIDLSSNGEVCAIVWILWIPSLNAIS